MSLDVPARSRVVYAFAARQVREARAPLMLGPPAHRIGAAILWVTTVVVAHLELHQLSAALRVHARRHVVGGGHTNHKAPASRVAIGERRGINGPIVVSIHAVVDRHVPGELGDVTVDFDLALVDDPLPESIRANKDVEPERHLPGYERGVRRARGWELASRLFV